MKCCVNLNIWGDQRIIADPDNIIVQKSTIHVYFTIIAKINIVTIIDIERSGNPEIFSFSAK